MAKKKSVLPPTMCDVTDCMRDAIYGFRQIVDTTTSDGSSKVYHLVGVRRITQNNTLCIFI
jgi:hypothetical protein